MILRDPVHGLISFEGDAERVVAALLGTREVQRLRRVRQLGLASLVFPGAEHSRFSHAIGTAWVMRRLTERLRAVEDALPREERPTDGDLRDALAAALLHDLGHGPYSHLFEDVLPDGGSHEDWGASILRDPETDVHRALERLEAGMAERVAGFLEGRHRCGYLARAVSGALDVDRCDYLLRDSHMTGVDFGVQDLDWLLRSLRFAALESEAGGTTHRVLAIEGRKGLPPVEAFFLGRHFMYQQVYHHKATRAAELLVRGIFRRVAELLRSGQAPPGVPVALRAAARGRPVTVGDYLALDDETVGAAFGAWERSSDPLLAELAGDLRRRALPKTMPLPLGPEAAAQRAQALEAAQEVARRHGLRADLRVHLDEAVHVPYAEPEPMDRSPTGLWVRLRHQPLQRLGAVSFLLRELRNKRSETARLIFPAAIRDQVHRAVEGVLA